MIHLSPDETLGDGIAAHGLEPAGAGTGGDAARLRSRATFVRRVAQAVECARETGQPVSLVLVDVDRFTAVNTRLGIAFGDRVLSELAIRLSRATRPIDTLARMGADEFGCLLVALGGGDADAIADRVLADLMEPFDSQRGPVAVASSIGVATFDGSESFDAEGLLGRATAALRFAKHAGGGRRATFSHAMAAEMRRELDLRGALLDAVEQEQLRVWYQPIVDVSGRRVEGFEALVRWEHPDLGFMEPDAFIRDAEAAGLIGIVDAWVLDRACRTAARWQALSGRPLSISVNVSSRELLEPQYATRLREVLERSQLAPELLQLEVTESVMLSGVERIEPLFAEIRALGVRIAFDDFGTGYSSLGYLERFRIDTLKIDRSFVERVGDASATAEVVRLIVSLAHALGMRVVAEGIERPAQLEALAALGCTNMQGYLFSRPVPEHQAESLLRDEWTGAEEIARIVRGASRTFAYEDLTARQREDLVVQTKAAIAAHDEWLALLGDAVECGRSTLDVASVARPELCPIGRWLGDTIDDGLRTSPLYAITSTRHAAFHRGAARLLALALAREPAARESFAPGGDFARVAALMSTALEDWLVLAG